MTGGIYGKLHTLQIPLSRERHGFAAAKSIGEIFHQSEKCGSPAYRASGTLLELELLVTPYVLRRRRRIAEPFKWGGGG
jgi:hypothetical protein